MVVATRKGGTSAIGTKRRCGSCQHRHIKCQYDGSDDKCKACRSANRQCIVRHRFHHVDPTAPKRNKTKEIPERRAAPNSPIPLADRDQESAHTSGIVFVQESVPNPKKKKEQNDDSSSTSGISEPVEQAQPLLSTPKSTALNTLQDDSSMHELLSTTSLASPSSNQFTDPSMFAIQSPFVSTSYSVSNLDFQSPTSTATPEALRSDDKEKAMLLRHFADILSRWFDVCDPDQHFKRVVPLRALTCATLMKAISAAAAWHLCRMGRFDRDRSNFLYENCLNHLIQAMDSPLVGTDDSVLVAAVIMHHVEELRDLEHTLNLESRGHIIGFNVFLEASDPNQLFSSLRTAAFRTAIREEIHVCFVDQQPLTLPAEVAKVDRSFGDADDDTWAWRMILIFRDALAYSLSPSSIGDWDALSTEQESWLSLRPDTFTPTYSRPARPEEGIQLPEKWYVHDCHTIGAIHYQLCRLVLAVSNPRTPKIGWAKAAALKRVEQEVQDSVVEICGIAASNHLFPSAMTAASMVVTMCAESIVDPNIQTALFEALPRTREVHSWPTEAAQKYVKSVWRAQQEQSPMSPRSARSRESFLIPTG